jgi:TetR/AcrR family transcriptional regulator, cholesterol catabolism regulator
VAAHVAAVAENLDALTVYFHEFRALAADSLATVRAQRERYTQLVGQIVTRGVRLGEFSTLDAEIATLGLIGMCNWMCQWYRPDGRLESSEIARQFADMVLDGLTISSRPGPARRASHRMNG